MRSPARCGGRCLRSARRSRRARTLLVALVEGEGAHFSAGADIAELGEVYRDAAATRDYGDAVQDGLKALMDLDRPTIARHSRGRGRRRAWPRARLRSEVLRRRRPSRHHARAGSASSMATPRRAGSPNLSDRRGPRTCCSPGGGSRPTRRWRSGSSTGGSRPRCRRPCSAMRAACADLSQASIRGGKRAVDAIVGRHEPGRRRVSRADRSRGASAPDFVGGAGGVRRQAGGEIPLPRPDRAAGAQLPSAVPDGPPAPSPFARSLSKAP